MDVIRKSITINDGNLFAISGENRYLVAECDAVVEVREHLINVPVLGKGKEVKGRDLVLLVTFHHTPKFDNIDSVDLLQFQGDVVRTDGVIETITLNNCQVLDRLDLTEAGKTRFEVKCSKGMVDKLRSM